MDQRVNLIDSLNQINRNKSSSFNDEMTSFILNDSFTDTLVRNISTQTTDNYVVPVLYQAVNAFDWVKILTYSPISFIEMFTLFEPHKIREELGRGRSATRDHTLLCWMYLVYTKYSLINYNGTQYNNSVENFNENDFFEQNKNDIEKYFDMLIQMYTNIKKFCIYLMPIDTEQLYIVQDLLDKNLEYCIGINSKNRFPEKYEILKNSIYNIHQLSCTIKKYKCNFRFIYNNIENEDLIPWERIETVYAQQGEGVDLQSGAINIPRLRMKNGGDFLWIDNVNIPWQVARVLLSNEKNTGKNERWYDWASQFWMYNKYRVWNDNFYQSNKLYFDLDITSIYRIIDVCFIDFSSAGSNLFMHDIMSDLNMINLQMCNLIISEDLFLVPPENIFSYRGSKMFIMNNGEDVGLIDLSIREKQTALFEKISSNLCKDLTVMVYTTDFAIISKAVLENLDCYITSIFMPPVKPSDIRRSIIENRTICGPLTYLVEENTRLYTYLMLTFLSRGSGLPIYSSFGFKNVFKSWYSIIKTRSSSVSRKNIESTSLWLARSNSNGIELNGILITELIIKMLGKTFKYSSGVKYKGISNNIGYSIYLQKTYEKMKEDNIFGSTKTQGVSVPETWIQNWNNQTILDIFSGEYDENPNGISDEIYMTSKTVEDREYELDGWFFGQQMYFEEYFSYPHNMDTLLDLIRIRFRDWCNTEEITINLS